MAITFGSTKEEIVELKLKQLRRRAGLSQDEIAERLGVKTSRYGTWERGQRMMSLAQAYDCAVALGCSIDEIAGHEVAQSFSDPREAELHRCWQGCTEENRHALLVMARNSAGESLNVAEPPCLQAEGA